MRCAHCGLTRKRHDHANRLVLAEYRHKWETPQTRRARLDRDRVQPSLIPLDQLPERPTS